MKDIRVWLGAHLGALALGNARDELPGWLSIATLAVHLAGLAATAYLIGQPIWLAPIILACLLILPIVDFRARGVFHLQTLAPLFFLYTIVALRFIFVRGFGGSVPGYFDYNPPDLRSTFFRLEPWLVCALAYSLAIQLHLFARRAFRFLPAIVILVVFAWASVLYIGHRTNGFTGTDPYAYAQMGIDLAARGTPLHRFTLFPSIASLNVAWSPMVHIGYHIPINADGDAPTVWPIGGSFAFALVYRLFGELGLYLVNPITSLLLLAATGWLAWEFSCDAKYRAWITATSIAILATSHTLFDWATVTMVDSQAALFSVLAIGLSLRFARQSNLMLPFLSGLALGFAYFVRHTQVLLAPAIVILLWRNNAPRRERFRALSIAGLAALLVALPDLWYHQVVFGSWLTPESTEHNLFSIASVGTTLATLNAEVFAAREFGWLVPFLVYGVFRLARDKQVAFTAFTAWIIVVGGFHLLYPALRPRDLLPEFPPLVIVIVFGIFTFIDWLRCGLIRWRELIFATGFIATFFLFLIRIWNVLPITFGEPQHAFGYLTVEQRAAFERIATLTPPRAVIGSTLNTGAIDLYARRETFLPALWSPREQDLFFATLWREGRSVYLLDDGAEASGVRKNLSQRYTLQQIAILDVPSFGAVDGTPGVLWEIIR